MRRGIKRRRLYVGVKMETKGCVGDLGIEGQAIAVDI